MLISIHFISSSANAQAQTYGEQRAAHFRSMSPSHPQRQSAAPQTGLGILMKSSGTPPPPPQQHILSQPPAPPNLTGTHHLHQPASFASLTLKDSNSNGNLSNHNYNNKSRMQDDLADRELQASSLAAAGMVAESVQTTRPATGNVRVHQGLQAPPALVGMAPPSQPPGGHLMEAVNWNQQLGLGDLNMGGVDDIDMDFATLFDPEQEQEYAMGEAMSGWTSSSTPSHSGSDMPDPSNSIPPSPTHYSGDHTNSTSV